MTDFIYSGSFEPLYIWKFYCLGTGEVQWRVFAHDWIFGDDDDINPAPYPPADKQSVAFKIRSVPGYIAPVQMINGPSMGRRCPIARVLKRDPIPAIAVQ